MLFSSVSCQYCQETELWDKNNTFLHTKQSPAEKHLTWTELCVAAAALVAMLTRPELRSKSSGFKLEQRPLPECRKPPHGKWTVLYRPRRTHYPSNESLPLAHILCYRHLLFVISYEHIKYRRMVEEKKNNNSKTDEARAFSLLIKEGEDFLHQVDCCSLFFSFEHHNFGANMPASVTG